MSDNIRLSGPHACTIIRNVAMIAARKYRRRPLWALVADITWHGSAVSMEICRAANLDPHQLITGHPLKRIDEFKT